MNHGGTEAQRRRVYRRERKERKTFQALRSLGSLRFVHSGFCVSVPLWLRDLFLAFDVQRPMVVVLKQLRHRPQGCQRKPFVPVMVERLALRAAAGRSATCTTLEVLQIAHFDNIFCALLVRSFDCGFAALCLCAAVVNPKRHGEADGFGQFFSFRLICG